MSTDNAYSEIAIDHASNPRNVGPLEQFNGHACITGPCGDTMEFWVYLHRGQVRAVSFVTDGCGSSLACGSMTTELAQGTTLEEAAALDQPRVLDALGGFPEAVQHCALLATTTLHAALDDYRERRAAQAGRGLLGHIAQPMRELLKAINPGTRD